ncbi:MAG: ATP phosphoribosyltransferase [Pseudomonadota bacterium]
MTEERLRLAIQKSGRLSDGTFDLLKKCGLTISRARDNLYGRARELPIDILLVRDDDIPSFVDDGVCDIGIVGGNVFEEHRLAEAARKDPDTRPQNTKAIRERMLGFSRCKLMLAAPKAWGDVSTSSYAGKRIATSYPGLTQAYLEKAGVIAEMVDMTGSVEVAPQLKIADAVCDIVSTGATLDAHGLAPTETVFKSEAILIRSGTAFSEGKEKAFQSLLLRISGVVASRDAKYVMLNAPRSAVDEISAILPGAEAPTILELAGRPDYVAVHTVCGEEVFWGTLEQLKKLGASAILVAPIEKMMP